MQLSAWFFLGFWFLYQLFEANFGLFGATANGGGVAFFAHVGGFLFGVLVAYALTTAGRLAPQDGVAAPADAHARSAGDESAVPFGPAERLVLETQDTEQETEGIHVTTTSIQALSTEIAGQVIAPDDADYESARQVFLPQIDRRPAAIFRPGDADEVASVVGLAQDQGLELAVRSGGHSAAGHGVSDGGIVLDLARMKALEIDPDARVAWAETGLTAGE